MGIREKVKVIVGGANVSPKWAYEIGSDLYGSDATDAVRKTLRPLFKNRKAKEEIRKFDCYCYLVSHFLGEIV
jgi:hypothetical protein